MESPLFLLLEIGRTNSPKIFPHKKRMIQTDPNLEKFNSIRPPVEMVLEERFPELLNFWLIPSILAEALG
jgi:hypothetical protein